jgi:hypothetical protein
MGKRAIWPWGIVGVMMIGVLAMVLWPAPDPLAGASTVALRLGERPPESVGIDYVHELRVVLSGRDIAIVSDESAADLVLVLDDVRVNLGDIEISLTQGRLRGNARAVCIVTDLRTGDVHTMDFVLRFEDGDVHAELTARKFWQFWK